MNFLETAEDEHLLAYFDVQNLSVDHSLIVSEIEQYKDLIFSPNNLHHIYFKDDCDIKTIELIKDLLSISEYVDDSRIDKYILLNLSSEEIDEILNSTFEFPDTWKLPYELVNQRFYLTDIPNFRSLKAFINKLTNKSLSPLEQLMTVYDQIKLMDYQTENEVHQLPDIISKRKANSYEMNKLLSYILNYFGFKTFIVKTKSKSGVSYITLVEVTDSKYNINGMYLFDPSMDNLSKENYRKENIRRINYNFFGISLPQFKRLRYKEMLTGIMSMLSIDDSSYSNEKIETSKSVKLLKEKEMILKNFRKNYQQLHQQLINTKSLDIEIILKITEVLYPNNDSKYKDMLKENFEIRKEELFFKDIDEELSELINSEEF